MVMQRFENFWMAEKSITEDIFFERSVSHSDSYVFDDIEFVGNSCEGVIVSGDYNCKTGAMGVNFHLKGIGAIRRFDIGGSKHKNVGRYHEHYLTKDSDAYPVNNLPFAKNRDDLKGLTPVVLWAAICKEANISHTEVFKDPTEWCP
jgi:hypothetical protein